MTSKASNQPSFGSDLQCTVLILDPVLVGHLATGRQYDVWKDSVLPEKMLQTESCPPQIGTACSSPQRYAGMLGFAEASKHSRANFVCSHLGLN